jgi:hypothetical protein
MAAKKKLDIVGKAWLVASVALIVGLILIDCGHPWIGLAITGTASLVSTCMAFLL